MFKQKCLNAFMVVLMLSLVACSGGGGSSGGGGYSGGGSGSGSGGSGSGGGGGPTIGSHTSPYILASEFVSALNNVDGTSSYVELYTNETYRSTVYGQDDWFVIYDDKFNEYKAVSLQYVRSIVYYDYYSNNSAVAAEFRSIERDDVLAGKLNGDYGGDDYEVVDRLSSGYYEGRESGYLYEDREETRDLSLQAKDSEQIKFFKKAANVSYTFNVSLETSMSMVTLGAKVEKMLKKGSKELTADDQKALLDDMQKLTGVSVAEIQAAAVDSSKKEAVVEKIAEKLGTSAQNLEDKLLPELFGVNI